MTRGGGGSAETVVNVADEPLKLVDVVPALMPPYAVDALSRPERGAGPQERAGPAVTTAATPRPDDSPTASGLGSSPAPPTQDDLERPSRQFGHLGPLRAGLVTVARRSARPVRVPHYWGSGTKR